MSSPNKVLEVGPLPPPYGGISVHVERLAAQARRDGWEVGIIDFHNLRIHSDTGGTREFSRFLAPLFLFEVLRTMVQGRFRIVHFHAAGTARFVFFGLPMVVLGRWIGVSNILTIHGGSFTSRAMNPRRLRNRLLGRVIAEMAVVVVVNAEQAAVLRDVYGVAQARLTIAPAFLSPTPEATDRVRRLLEKCLSSGKNIVISSGYGLDFYGYELILSAVSRLVEASDYCVLICLYGQYDEEYIGELASVFPMLNVVITRDLSPGEFAWLLSNAYVYVRATDRDGDAVAIREALYFGVPVVASDCVARPEGVVEFKAGDRDSLHDALKAFNREQGRKCESRASGLDFAFSFSGLYSKIKRIG